MLYAAIDIHKRTFHAAVLDVETAEASERRFGATREELNDRAMPLQGKLRQAAIEARSTVSPLVAAGAPACARRRAALADVRRRLQRRCLPCADDVRVALAQPVLRNQNRAKEIR